MKITCCIHGAYDTRTESGCPGCVVDARGILQAGEELLAAARASRSRETGAAARFQDACEKMQALINAARGRV